MEERRAHPNPVIGLLVILTIAYLATYIGHLGLLRGAGDWYVTLMRPPWAPPVVLLGLVPLVLAGLLGSAAWQLWRAAQLSGAPAWLLALVLALAALWPWLLFTWHRFPLSFVAVLVLALCSALAAWAIRRVNPGAGALIIPLVAWYFYLSAVAFSLWRMNV